MMQDEISFSFGGTKNSHPSSHDIDAHLQKKTPENAILSEYNSAIQTTMKSKSSSYTHDLKLDVESDHIRATMLGGPTLSLTQNAIDAIMHAAEIHGIYRILIDSRRQYAEPSIVDCFEFAKHIASQKPWLNFLVAVIVHSESVEAAEFAEIVAKNRGIVLKIFSQKSNAVAWLRNGKDSTPDTL